MRQATRFFTGALFSVLAMVCTNVNAAYPDRTVKIVVGYAPGGGADIVARVMAAELSKQMDQPFVVENRAGAANNIAVEYVSRAEPDGYTLLFSAVTSAINHSLYKNLNFNFLEDFEHIAKVAEGGFFLLVPKESPADSPQDLVKMLKEADGGMFFASSGIGTSIHSTGEMFLLHTDTEAEHVPYRGSALALTGLMAGETDFSFDNSALSHIKAGSVKALAATTANRSSQLPDIPTLQELGYDDFLSTWWYGVSAPKGTPDDVVKVINENLIKALQKPKVQEALKQLGEVPPGNSPQEFTDFIAEDVARWKTVIDATGMVAE